MGLADRITAIVDVLGAESPEGVQARRRAVATAGMAAFFAVLLVLVGLGQIVLLVGAVVLSLALVVAGLLFARRYRAALGALRGVGGHAKRAGGSLGDATRRGASRLGGAASRAAGDTRRSVEAHAPRIRDGYSRAQAVAGRHLATATTHAHRHARTAATSVAAATKDAWPTRTPVVRQREAVQANAAGVQLRRENAYFEAAERHRHALALFRELGDRRSEALTLNNLALALDHAGDEKALDLFEQAATILGELGEEEHEGKVIANLGLAFRRRGNEEQSAEVLELALEKLDPDSQAYRTVERLRHAS